MKTKHWIIIGMISLIAILAFIFFIAPSLNINFLDIAGVNTLSLSQANFQSNNPLLNGQVWILTFTEGSLAQHYFGTFSPSDISSLTGGTTTTTQPFSIGVDFQSETCNYPIQSASYSTPIYEDLQIQQFSCPNTQQLPTVQQGKQSTGLATVLYAVRTPDSPTNCYAIGYNVYSPVGSINTPSVDSNYQITITTPTGSAVKSIDTSTGSGQGAIGDFAYAAWNGNLVSGQSCPGTSNYVPIYKSSSWILGSQNAYNNYISLINSPQVSSSASLSTWLSQVKTAILQLESPQSFGNLNTPSSITNAVVQVTQNTPIQFPVTTLYISASSIGAYTPTPKAQFLGSNSSCFNAANGGQIIANLENIGDEEGSWNVYASCNSPFSSTGTYTVSINKGQSQQIAIPISVLAPQNINGTCTLNAESPAGTIFQNVNVCATPIQTCTPNQIFCGLSGTNQTVEQCNSQGTGISILQICTSNQICSLNQQKCVEPIMQNSSIIWIILGGVIVIIITIILFLRKKSKYKR